MFTFLGAFLGAVCVSLAGALARRGPMIGLAIAAALIAGVAIGAASTTLPMLALFADAAASGWKPAGIRYVALTLPTLLAALAMAAPFIALSPRRI